jgi:hypothetical protein
MHKIHNILQDRFAEANGAPFLFLGSGFSQRYLGIDTWEQLIERFSNYTNYPKDYYISESSNDLAQASSLLAGKFSEVWWQGESFKKSRTKKGVKLTSPSSPLKLEIANYLESFDCSIINKGMEAELDFLRGVDIEGVITTNYDQLCENVFSGYRKFVGQDSLISGCAQGVGEIYKIHGCASEPDSIVLTSEDLTNFRERAPYLAAKLITIFVEHPIVFVGYQLGDKNIQEILLLIAKGLGKEAAEKIRGNLIFIQRKKKGRIDGVSEGQIAVGDSFLPVTSVVTDNFIEVYEALHSHKRKIPAKILRFIKEQLVEVVKEEEPQNRVRVISLDEIGNDEKIDFVVGVGVINQYASAIGYKTPSYKSLFSELFDEKLNSSEMLKSGLRECIKTGKQFIPVHVFFDRAKVDFKDRRSVATKGGFIRVYKASSSDFKLSDSYLKEFRNNCKGFNVAQIIDKYIHAPWKAAMFITALPAEAVDVESMAKFLLDHLCDVEDHKYATFYRKLGAYYDFVCYGPNPRRPKKIKVPLRKK